MTLLRIPFIFLAVLARNRLGLTAEKLPLRQQLIILQRSARLSRLGPRDRIFQVWLSRLWRDWQSALPLVKPDTAVR
jgi:hypothetical protein